ncbi:C-24(28) sterol reductase, partial [Spiromyces aspiralis]
MARRHASSEYGAVEPTASSTSSIAATRARGPSDDAPATDTTDNLAVYEFGGPLGCLAILIGIPLLMGYSWVCLQTNGGHFLIPDLSDPIGWFVERVWGSYVETATPNWYAAKIYLGFTFFMVAIFYIMPGPTMYGYRVPMYNGERLKYKCNALWSWWAAQIVAAALHLLGWFDLGDIYRQLGPITSVAIIWGFFVSFAVYFITVAMGKQHR